MGGGFRGDFENHCSTHLNFYFHSLTLPKLGGRVYGENTRGKISGTPKELGGVLTAQCKTV